jgi:hypothetical protein
MSEATPDQRLEAMLAEFTPDIAARAAEAIERLRARLPTATVLVYDNYNALAVGFLPNDRPSDAIVSIAVYPRWVTLCFLKNGPALPDPEGLLKGEGTRVRHLRLPQASHLDSPAVAALLDAAVAMADPPMPVSPPGALSIRSVSARRRPRQPLG